MGKYHSHLHGNKDEHLWYVVERGRIDTYDKPVLKFWQRAKISHTFNLNSGTKILEEKVEPNGNGSFNIQTGNDTRRYWVHAQAQQFIDDVKKQLG